MYRKMNYHHGDLRAVLVESARALIEEHGPDKLSLSDACRSAGVSTAAPYRHFAAKDDLLVAVVLEGMHRHRDTMQAALAGHAPGSDAAVAALGVAYVGFAVQNPGVFRLMFGLTRSHRGQAELIEAGCASLGVLLGQVAHRYGLAPDDPAVMTRGFQLWTYVHGLAFLLIDDKVADLALQVDIPCLVADTARRMLRD
jgi:AcrR family transcriptional regulator